MLFLLLRILIISVSKDIVFYKDQRKDNKYKYKFHIFLSFVLQPHPSSDDILIIPENEYCQSGRMTIFVGSIYAYKGLLMVCFS